MRNAAPITKIDAALTIVWPDDLRTVLLRACLWTGVKAEKSWREFVSETGDSKVFFERDSSGLKGLLPLVHAAARRNSFELDEQSWTYLRAAAVREELRYGVYRQICGRVLRACVDADIPVIALKACALADTVYSTPAERHCHAIDLLVSRNSLAGIERLVRPLGFRPARVAEARLGGRRGFRHESGLPLIFHERLFDPPNYPADTNSLWSASTPEFVAGVPVRVLAPAHSILHVLGGAFHDQKRNNLRWTCDAWRLFNGRNYSDWQELILQTQGGKLELPVLTMLQYLAGPLRANVPDDVFTALATSASKRSSRLVYEGALSGAIGGLSALLEIWSHRLPTNEARRIVLRFLLWPSGAYLQWRFGNKSRICLPFLYLCRPLQFVGQRVWARCLRLPGLNRFTHYGRVSAEMKKMRA